jgi:hypothetical protein
MSMVLAHAAVILPAIVRRPLPYHAALWAPLVLLHAGLAVRVGGDLVGSRTPWVVGSVATVVALLMLPPVLVTLAARAPRRGRTGAGYPPGRPLTTSTLGAMAPRAQDDERSEAAR